MKKIFTTLSLFCFMAIASQASATSLTLSPASQGVSVGDTASVNVNLALDPNEDLYAFNFDLNFDNALLDFVSLDWNDSVSPFLLGNGFTSPADPAGLAGHVTFDGGSLAGLFDTFTLATLNFNVVGQGTSLLGLTGAVDTYFYGADPLGSLDQIHSYTLAASGAMEPVPEPATLMLLGTGLAGLGGFRRKLRQAAVAA